MGEAKKLIVIILTSKQNQLIKNPIILIFRVVFVGSHATTIEDARHHIFMPPTKLSSIRGGGGGGGEEEKEGEGEQQQYY